MCVCGFVFFSFILINIKNVLIIIIIIYDMSTDHNVLNVKFRIDNQIITLYEPLDESDHLFKVTNDDEYTIKYLFELINSGHISLDNPMRNIFRIDDDESEKLIYPLHGPLQEDTMGVFEESQGESNEDNTKITGGSKEVNLWTDGETKMLLDLYEQYMTKVGPMKQFKTKKNMWAKIAELLNKYFQTNKTGIQCENRYKTVLKRKKAAVENNHKSGNSRTEVPFEEELAKIASVDDSVQPEVVGSAQGIKILKSKTINVSNVDQTEAGPSGRQDTPTPKTSINDSGKKRKTVQETLWEIYEKKRRSKR